MVVGTLLWVLQAASSPIRRQLLGAMGDLSDPMGDNPDSSPNSGYWHAQTPLPSNCFLPGQESELGLFVAGLRVRTSGFRSRFGPRSAGPPALCCTGRLLGRSPSTTEALSCLAWARGPPVTTRATACTSNAGFFLRRKMLPWFN